MSGAYLSTRPGLRVGGVGALAHNVGMIERIAKLLNKAERAATPEEAQAYFDKAQALATAHSITLAKARLVTSQVRVEPISKRLQVGRPRQHANRHLINLMSSVARANDLKLDIAHNSTYLLLYGFPSDIATAEMLWTNISTQMVRYCEQFLATDVWRSDKRLIREGYLSRTAPMTKQTARAQYYESFISTVGQRLHKARKREVAEQERRDREAQREAAAAAAAAQTAQPAGASTDIALRAKAAAVDDFYRQSSNARGSWNGGSKVMGLSRSADEAGRRDGHRVSLGGQPTVSGGRRGLPK